MSDSDKSESSECTFSEGDDIDQITIDEAEDNMMNMPSYEASMTSDTRSDLSAN